MAEPVTIPVLQQMKRDGKKSVGFVAWDYQIALIAERAGADFISVGDSVGVNLWGHANPLEVTLDEIMVCCKAVRRASARMLLSCDIPFGPVQQGIDSALQAAIRLVKEGGELTKGRDGKPYATLGFANGPGSICREQEDKSWRCERDDLTNVDTTDKDFLQPSLTPLGSETHGGEDVAIFAGGPGANLFSGTVEQNEIFHVMAKGLRLVN